MGYKELHTGHPWIVDTPGLGYGVQGSAERKGFKKDFEGSNLVVLNLRDSKGKRWS